MKTYLFSVQYEPGCYRHIEIAQDATLSKLHKAILTGFGIPEGRTHVFFMNNCAWDNTEGYYPSGFGDSLKPATDEVRLLDFKLKKDTKYIYVYDLAQENRFSVKLLREEESAEKALPRVTRSKGEFMLKARKTQEKDEQGKTAYSNPKAERNRLIDMYATASVNLYGVLPLDIFCKIFNSHGHEPLEEAEALSVLQKTTGREYVIYENYLAFSVGDSVEQLVKTIIKQTEGKPRYVPNNAEEFLKYLDLYYTEIPETIEKLHDHFERVLKNKTEVSLVLGEFMQMLRLGYPLQEFAELIDSFALEYQSPDDGDAYFALVIEAKNNSRTWENKGFTPREMASLRMQMQKGAAQKVGRNDPCPCGSGKKYKRCCGSAN